MGLAEQLRIAYRNLHPSYRLRIDKAKCSSFTELQRLGKDEETRRREERSYRPPPSLENSAFPSFAYIAPKYQRSNRLASIANEQLADEMAPAVLTNLAPIANPLQSREVRLKDEVEGSNRIQTLPKNNKVARKPSFSEVIEANKGKPRLNAPSSPRLHRAAQARRSQSPGRGNKPTNSPVTAEASSSQQKGTAAVTN